MTHTSDFDLKDLAHARAKGIHKGIYSVCSAHPWVIEAAMRQVLDGDDVLLIEATCNQVNQFGGYTGMTPADFRDYALGIAECVGFPANRLLLGGDHLGPNPWKNLPADEAMKNSEDLVAAFVDAGFTKIHLDTSMGCKGDPTPLPDATIAERAARLAKVTEGRAGSEKLRYVIGTEVPTPGGAVEEELTVSVTKYKDAEHALLIHKEAFAAQGLDAMWDKVVALVVQPGVEFGHDDVVEYDSEKAKELCSLLDAHEGLIFEAHSTDYQLPQAYRELARDGFPILKVGPALTFAMREVLFALEAIERFLIPKNAWSNLAEIAERVMVEKPDNWKHHYHGDERTLHILRIASYSDRIRYYWNVPEIETTVAKLIANLSGVEIPETLLSAYLPVQYARVREGLVGKTPVALVLDGIQCMLEPYVLACK